MTDIDLPQWREGYAAALAASEGLKAALAGLGIPERGYRSIRPTTTSAGRPYVYLGILNATAVEAITAVLQHELVNASKQTEAGQGARPSPLSDATSPPRVTQCSCARRAERPRPVE